MIYYLLVAIVDIGLYIGEHWKDLTFTAAASGIGIILGKRLGVRFTVDYFMKTFGLQKKSTIEQQVIWLIEQERKRGNVWSAEPSNFKRNIIGRSSRLRWVIAYRVPSVGLFIRRMVTNLLKLRRKKRMKNFLTGKKKWLAFLIAVAVNGLDSTLGLGLGTETVNNITQGATGYIVIEGALDFTRALTDYFKSKGAKPVDQLNIPIEPPI